jgi:hypothetical protein
MNRNLLSALIAILLLTVTACSASLPAGESGSIALVPFFREEAGIRGVVPVGCEQIELPTYQCADSSQTPAIIMQQVVPATLDEVVPVLVEQLSLEAWPESTGRYEGEAFTWDLYAFEAENLEEGSGVYRVDLALAGGDAASYLVAMVTEPAQYAANAAMYASLFNHMVYGLAPLE